MAEQASGLAARLCAIFVAVAVIVATTPAVASSPESSSGTFGPTGPGVITVTNVADGNVFIDWSDRPGAFTGTFTGTYSEHLRVVVHADGSTNFAAQLTCVCAVDGRTGTITIRLDGTGTPAGFEAHYRIVGGTGGLADLHGEGTLSAPPATYSGRHHFD